MPSLSPPPCGCKLRACSRAAAGRVVWRAAAVRKEVARLKLDLEEDELQAMLADARRLRARQEQGGWALQEEEEENVRKRQAELKGEQQRDSEDVNKMRGLRIRKARLRSVNRTRLKVRGSAGPAGLPWRRQLSGSVV